MPAPRVTPGDTPPHARPDSFSQRKSENLRRPILKPLCLKSRKIANENFSRPFGQAISSLDHPPHRTTPHLARNLSCRASPLAIHEMPRVPQTRPPFSYSARTGRNRLNQSAAFVAEAVAARRSCRRVGHHSNTNAAAPISGSPAQQKAESDSPVLGHVVAASCSAYFAESVRRCLSLADFRCRENSCPHADPTRACPTSGVTCSSVITGPAFALIAGEACN